MAVPLAGSRGGSPGRRVPTRRASAGAICHRSPGPEAVRRLRGLAGEKGGAARRGGAESGCAVGGMVERAFELSQVVVERGGAPVLAGVSVAVPAGAITALVGPSGAGKTTLLRLLNRLDDPSGGEIRFRGRPIEEYPVRSLRCAVGFVFQAPVMFPGTVEDNLRTAAELSPGRSGARGAGWVGRLLELVELLPAYADRRAGDLSGGEKQRVALARALATGPEVLLLDEPTSSLDPEVAERLLATVSRINAEQGHTMVMVTHRLAEARAVSSFTMLLEAGRVVEAGATSELFERPREARTRQYLMTGR